MVAEKKQTQLYTSTLLNGNAALDFIQDPIFLEQWIQLAKHCNSFTICQEPAFVLSWYACYRENFEPIVIYAIEKHKLVGLICLAWHNEKAYLTHAGGEDAEYHGWLAKPSLEIRFLQDVFRHVKEAFSISNWEWRWLPPNSADTFFKAIPTDLSYSYLEQESPIWNLLKTEKLKKLLKSKSFKVKKNRLKKRGDFYLETITNKRRLNEIFPEIMAQHDFIKEINYNIRPYHQDKNRQVFFCELINQGIAQMNVLWLNNTIVASHLGVGDNHRICLLYTSPSPRDQRGSRMPSSA